MTPKLVLSVKLALANASPLPVGCLPSGLSAEYEKGCLPSKDLDIAGDRSESVRMERNYVSASQVQATGYTMIALSSAVVIARFSLIFWKLRSLQVEDGCILLSWACFLAMSIAYIIVTPVVYKIDAYTDGKIGSWATMLSDALFMIKVFFANTMLLWASLWSVKLSFLFLYRRLLQDLPGEMKWWYAVLCFCIVVRP